jgi:hypothetical protein
MQGSNHPGSPQYACIFGFKVDTHGHSVISWYHKTHPRADTVTARIANVPPGGLPGSPCGACNFVLKPPNEPFHTSMQSYLLIYSHLCTCMRSTTLSDPHSLPVAHMLCEGPHNLPQRLAPGRALVQAAAVLKPQPGVTITR